METRLQLNIIFKSMVTYFVLSTYIYGATVKDNSMKEQHLTIHQEQIFWNKYIINKKETYRALSLHTGSFKSKIETFDSEIKDNKIYNNEVLFFRINNDNGVKDFFYCAWDKKKFFTITSSSLKDTIDCSKYARRISSIFSKIPFAYIDIKDKDKTLIGSTQYYVSIKQDNTIKRVASYHPYFKQKSNIRDDVNKFFKAFLIYTDELKMK